MSSLILILSIVLPVLILVGAVLGWRYLFDRDRRRRTPLNRSRFGATAA